MDSKANITLRLAKLNQQIDGKCASGSTVQYVSRDALLDSLLALYDECERKLHQQRKSPPKHVANFVNRVAKSIGEIKSLRVNIGDFETVKLIGQGHFGQVKVVKEKMTGEVYALKIIRKTDILSHQEAAYFEEERDIMAKSNNAWLTQLQYAFQDVNNLYLAMDFHPGGDLAILLNRYETLSEDMASFYVAEMTLAIHAVHCLGYIHRDIKPDNFLIDRIGHLKLTDFGSAAKMDRDGKVSGKMPVGTPDYIAPELLTSITSSSDKPYNRLVDWWSLGIITYEMICGNLPFSDEDHSVVTTYGNIMKFKERLVLNSSSLTLTVNSKQFISALLTECKFRMGYDQITAHKFLADLDLPKIRNSSPPYIPKVSSNADTTNFEEVVARQHSPRDDVDHPEFKDLPFVGFTTNRNLALLKAKQTINSSSHSLADRLLSPRMGDPDGCDPSDLMQYERKEAALRKELEKMHAALKQKDAYIDKLENERETQSREMAYLYATNSDLSDQNKVLANNLDSTRGLYDKVVSETEDYMRVLNSRKSDQTEYEDIMSQELDNLKDELERMDRLVVEKDVKLVAVSKKVERLERERNELRSQIEQERQRADKASHQLSTYHKSDRHGTLVVKCEIETQHVQSEEKVSELQQQLDKVLSSNRASKDMLEQMRGEKQRLEQELEAVKNISSRRQADRESELKRHTICDTEKMKLSRLEVRNAELSSEINERCQQAQQLAMKLSELTDQVEDAHRMCETEKLARLEVETSLRERIAELEQRLLKVTRDAESLRSERHSASDSEPEKIRIVTEQEQTIAILQANVEKLENLVVGMRDGFDEKEQRRDQRGRQETRRWAEIVGELKQENMYLERKIEHLNAQLQAKVDFETSFTERLKSAREELRQVKATSETEVTALNKRALEAEMKLSDSKCEAVAAVQSERVLRRKFENLQAQIKQRESDSEQRQQDLLNEKQTLCSQIEILKEETQIIDELEAEVTRLAQKCAALDAENNSLKDQTRRAVEAKTNANMRLDNLEMEKRTADRKHDSENEELRKLKLVCSEMELNTQDLEHIVDDLERKQKECWAERDGLKSTVSDLQARAERLEASLQAERNQRHAVDERNERTKQALQTQIISHRTKEGNLHQEIEQQRVTVDRLRQQVQTQGRDISHLDKERRSIKVRLSQAENEIRKLKEEASTWKTQVSNLKAANCSLSTDLEIVMDKLDEITEKKHVVENSMENLVLTKEHESYKSEQIVSQQTKLIDFLQQKYETPMKKKKSGSKLFAPKRKDGQRDEFAHALESERNRNRKLQDEVKDLKTELFQSKVYSMKGVRDLSSMSSIQQTPRPEPLGDGASDVGSSSSTTTKSVSSHRTMKHNIPHRLSLQMNKCATKCAVCQSSVMFGQQAARCQECRIVTHQQCQSDLPSTCGLPSQFMQLYSTSLEKKSLNSAGGVLEADLTLVELGGWMKVRGIEGSAAGWTKSFVLIENQILSFYKSDDLSLEAVDKLDLRPTYGSVNLISDVNPAELKSTICSDDLPYIIKIEFTSLRAPKTVYLLTANFSEKDKWDSTLEAIVKRGSIADATHKENTLLGNRLLQLDGDCLIDVNCTTLLGEDDILLLGAEEGLYACQLSYTSEPMIRIEGVSSVFQMSSLSLPDSLLLITGTDRSLYTTSYSSLLSKLCNRQNTISGSVAITADNIERIKQCRMFSTCEDSGRCTVVAATFESIFVLHYSNSQRVFGIIQAVGIDEPCSCISYTPDLLLFGTDTVYKLTVKNGCIRPFLAAGVKEDTSYSSIPIDILCLSKHDSTNKEYLCCFTDVGVFVDTHGEKTRSENIQWSGLPLAFAYRSPYLYVIYYKAIQVIGLVQLPQPRWKNMQTFLNIQSPRYLGPAYTDGAVYIASQQNNCTDIVVFKGNLAPIVEDCDAQSETSSEAFSEQDYVPQGYAAQDFYHRNNKENHPRSRMPSMIQRYQAAALRTGILPTSSSSQQQSSSSSSSSSSSVTSESSSSRPRTPLGSDYFNHMYGAGKKKPSQQSTPQHTNV